MKKVKAADRELWETETAKIYLYPFQLKEIDCCVAEIRGRHPLKGWFRNTKVKEMIYCKSGYGKIEFHNGGIKELHENDAIFIDKNEWYFWHDTTKGVFVPVCSPAWSSEQGETKEF